MPKGDIIVGLGRIISWVNDNLGNADLSTTGSPVLSHVNICLYSGDKLEVFAGRNGIDG